MPRHPLAAWLEQRVLISDGATGTMLDSGPDGAGCPDEQNLSRPQAVAAVHRAYLAAGADIIQTNTFGSNPARLARYGLEGRAPELNRQAAALARREAQACGRPVLVAGCIGPTGHLLRPYGDFSPQACYESFLAQATALAAAGVDAFNVETMSDLLEAKLAVIAARTAAPGAPVFCSMTYDGRGRTFTGADPQACAVTLEALDVAAVGVNCVEPEQAEAILRHLAAATTRPVMVRPNAGLPSLDAQGRPVWRAAPSDLAGWAAGYADRGAAIIGGCCGTTPDHIAAMAAVLRGRPGPRRRQPGPDQGGWLAGSGRAVQVGGGRPTRLVGERINAAARPELRGALQASDWQRLAGEALAQAQAGADVIDIHVATAGPDEPRLMAEAVLAVQRAVALPVSLDSADPAALEGGLLVARGKPLINSTTADPEQLGPCMALARRYGAAIVGLPMEQGKVPDHPQDRVGLARRIVAAAAAAGVPAHDVYLDGLVLAAGVAPGQARAALDTVAAVREQLGTGTILGISNVSHGMPGRDHLNSAFLAMAIASGLDLAIANPLAEVLPGLMRAADLLCGRDPGARGYLAWASRGRPADQAAAPAGPGAGADPGRDLAEAVRDGDGLSAARIAARLAGQGWTVADLLDRWVRPGLEDIGAQYEAGRAYLPQLLLAAEAAQAALAALAALAPPAGAGPGPEPAGRVLIATVRGDLHDLGKNIVALLLRCHGFLVCDLGRDVGAEAIAAQVRQEEPHLVALSALMTTTLPEMGLVVQALRAMGSPVPVLTGGAVTSAEHARSIGAHWAPDAAAGVRVAKELVSRVRADLVR